MNRNFFLFLLLLITTISCKSEAEKIEEKIALRDAKIDSTIINFEQHYLLNNIDSVFSKNEFNGTVSVFKNNRILYEKANGFENFENQIKIDSNSVFAIASISKQFTAVLLLMQEDQAKLYTDDKVALYLETFNAKPWEQITIKQLLNHTSGISDFGSGLLSKPGKEFHYSNKGYRYLGEVIEKVSGKSFDENARELFQKLQMNNTSTANIFKGEHFASAYTGITTKFQGVENMPKRLSEKEISVPAGGILSTPKDLNIWNNALYGGIILKPKSLKKFLQKSAERNHPVLGNINYGFGIMMNAENSDSYFHTGYVKGSPSLNIYYPETKISVIILSNIANESTGKIAVFKPHKEIKKLTDSLHHTVITMRNEMMKVPMVE